MPHGYYLHYHDIFNPNNTRTGIDSKVATQIQVLNEHGVDCEYLFCPQPETIPSMIKSCLPFAPDGIKWPDPSQLDDVDFVYIRRPRFASAQLLNFLKELKTLHPDSLVLYEVPTYPYDKEMFSPKMRFALAKDRKNRTNLKEFVDFVVDLSGANRIFDIPTIEITNGVDFDTLQIRNPTLGHDAINIMAAAYFEPWHGIDRFIHGLADYYDKGGSREIILHLAGGGSQLGKLKAIARTRKVNDHVIFYGPLDQNELSILYDLCDLGIECLGIHRKDEDSRSSSLKSREYLAKGLPFIHSSNIDVFSEKDINFCKRVSADESPIDIHTVLDFRDDLYRSETATQIAHRMRAFGEECISMDAAFANVVTLLSTDTSETQGLSDLA